LENVDWIAWGTDTADTYRHANFPDGLLQILIYLMKWLGGLFLKIKWQSNYHCT